MEHVLAIALSFPCVVFTTLLGVALVYWMFVMIGAASVNLLGHGGDGALEGADGADAGEVGGHDAAGGHDGADGGHDGADGDGDGDGDAADGDGQVHGLGAMMVALKLRSAPATVVLSCLFLYSWLVSMFGMQLAEALPAGEGIAKVALLVLAPLIALIPTSLTVRPLARFFVPSQAVANMDFVGKVCTIRTGKVTEKFGEAMFEDGGVGVVLRVRVESGEKLERGQQAVITGYDKERAEFTVTPMDIGLDDEHETPPEEKKLSR
jgi:hypothetical protein